MYGLERLLFRTGSEHTSLNSTHTKHVKNSARLRNSHARLFNNELNSFEHDMWLPMKK